MNKTPINLQGLQGDLQGYLQGKSRAVIGICSTCRAFARTCACAHTRTHAHTRTRPRTSARVCPPANTANTAKELFCKDYFFKTPAKTPANLAHTPANPFFGAVFMAEKPRTMAADMPQCHAFIKAMMQAFGADHIKTQIKRGMDGLPGFYAEENGHIVGTPMPTARHSASVADMCFDKIIDTTKPNWWKQEA